MSSMTKQSSFEWIVYIFILTYNSQVFFGSINTFILKKQNCNNKAEKKANYIFNWKLYIFNILFKKVISLYILIYSLITKNTSYYPFEVVHFPHS